MRLANHVTRVLFSCDTTTEYGGVRRGRGTSVDCFSSFINFWLINSWIIDLGLNETFFSSGLRSNQRTQPTQSTLKESKHQDAPLINEQSENSSSTSHVYLVVFVLDFSIILAFPSPWLADGVRNLQGETKNQQLCKDLNKHKIQGRVGNGGVCWTCKLGWVCSSETRWRLHIGKHVKLGVNWSL